MKTKIHSRTELRSEIERLKQLRLSKEIKIRTDFDNLAEQLKPANLVKSAFSSLAGDSELKNQVASKGTEAALGFLFTNLIFKNANPLIRTIAAVAGTAAASKIFGEDSSKYIEKIKNIYHKIRRKKSKDADFTFNERDIYKNGD